MSLRALLTDEQVDNKVESMDHIFNWKEPLSILIESTLMVENLVIKRNKLSKEALLPTYVKNKNKCIETSPLREPD